MFKLQTIPVCIDPSPPRFLQNLPRGVEISQPHPDFGIALTRQPPRLSSICIIAIWNLPAFFLTC